MFILIKDNCISNAYVNVQLDISIDWERPIHINTDHWVKLYVCNVSLDSFQQKVLLLVHLVCPKSFQSAGISGFLCRTLMPVSVQHDLLLSQVHLHLWNDLDKLIERKIPLSMIKERKDQLESMKARSVLNRLLVCSCCPLLIAIPSSGSSMSTFFL